MWIGTFVANSGYGPPRVKNVWDWPIQDSENARLAPCALPYLAIAPASIILLILLRHTLSPLYRRWSPEWTESFISEQHEQDIPSEGVKQDLQWTVILLVFSVIGFAVETVLLFLQSFELPSLVLAASWVSCLRRTWFFLSDPSRPQYVYWSSLNDQGHAQF